MTLYEIDVLSVRYRRVQEREDRRAAMPAWLLANINRDSDHRYLPFSLEEVVSWLGHGFQRPEEEEPAAQPTVEELAERVHLLNDLYGGGQTTNGQR